MSKWNGVKLEELHSKESKEAKGANFVKRILRLFRVSLTTVTSVGIGVTQAISEALAGYVPHLTAIGELVSVDAKADTLMVGELYAATGALVL